VDSLNLYKGPTKFWNAIKSFKNSPCFEDLTAVSISDTQIINDNYISKFAPDGMVEFIRECIRDKYSSFFDFRFDLLELREIINSLKNKSSPGPDMLNNTILKLIPDKGLSNLLDIFERIMKGKFYPEIWRKFIVILLQKPSREDFRLISLASCILKALKRLVKRRLKKFMEMDYVIPDSQFGFRKGRSYEDCLAILNLEIYNSFMKEEYVMGLCSSILNMIRI